MKPRVCLWITSCSFTFTWNRVELKPESWQFSPVCQCNICQNGVDRLLCVLVYSPPFLSCIVSLKVSVVTSSITTESSTIFRPPDFAVASHEDGSNHFSVTILRDDLLFVFPIEQETRNRIRKLLTCFSMMLYNR